MLPPSVDARMQTDPLELRSSPVSQYDVYTGPFKPWSRHALQGYPGVQGVGSTFSGQRKGLSSLRTSLSGSVHLEQQHAFCKVLFPVQRGHSAGHLSE